MKQFKSDLDECSHNECDHVCELNKHTSGPWEVLSTGRGPLEMFRVNSLHGYTTAECGPSEANARLIAAAPELLEALKQLLEEIPNKGVVTQLTIKEAYNAINKATGSV